ncbi:MAG: pseudouridine synthase [Proteobacteria bacterium]|nr:pseudouridine synthase [Pseudomonadota bacterium]MDA0982086.1 pseudouridine synthase [Pseudomonadota bacterium]
MQKLLAAAGLGSRRAIEVWISDGRVTMDGKVAKLGDRALPGALIAVDGKSVATAVTAAAPRLLLYHKPVGELVTRADPEGRATVFERLPPLKGGRWVSVGRLDLNSAGLLLFTDSGELANRFMHPRHGVDREYHARVKGELTVEEQGHLCQGVTLEDGLARFTRIAPIPRAADEGVNRWYRVVIREGRTREVRRMFESLGHPVSRLVRKRFGPVELPANLSAGRWVEASPALVASFLKVALR